MNMNIALPFSSDHSPSRGDSLADARAYVEANKDKGCTCWACDGYVKRYWRNIYHTQVVGLATLYRLMLNGEPGAYYHRRLLNQPNNDLAMLRWWDLVEEQPKEKNRDKKKKSSGMWRLTARGIQFLLGRISVPKYVVLYHDRFEGFDGPPWTVRECLKKNFSYEELMAGIPADLNGENGPGAD